LEPVKPIGFQDDEEDPVRRVMVRYKVKPDHVAANEQLVRDVYDELTHVRPDGFRYGTFKLKDEVSFVHMAAQEDDETPPSAIASFQRFQENIRERGSEPPVVTRLEEIGSFRFDGAAS
jgi:hypothetical protein